MNKLYKDVYLFVWNSEFSEIWHKSDNTAFFLFNEQLDTDSGHVTATHLLVPKKNWTSLVFN